MSLARSPWNTAAANLARKLEAVSSRCSFLEEVGALLLQSDRLCDPKEAAQLHLAVKEGVFYFFANSCFFSSSLLAVARSAINSLVRFSRSFLSQSAFLSTTTLNSLHSKQALTAASLDGQRMSPLFVHVSKFITPATVVDMSPDLFL